MIRMFRTIWGKRRSAWRHFAAGALAGCTIFLGSARPGIPAPQTDEERLGYVPTAAEEQLPNELRRQAVFFRSTESAGTIIVHTQERFLYLVQPNNRAIRYGIGVGREGFQWTGLKRIDRKAEWPDWTPPPEMIERQPYLPRFMAGGSGQSDGRTRALHQRDGLSHSWDQRAPHDRDGGFVRLLPPDKSGAHRSLRAGPGRHQGRCPSSCRPLAEVSLVNLCQRGRRTGSPTLKSMLLVEDRAETRSTIGRLP